MPRTYLPQRNTSVPAIQSMTGFARRETALAAGQLSCEIRSVNHRYLELQLRVPDALRGAEHAARECLRQRLGRGKVDCTLRFVPRAADQQGLALDEATLNAVLEACARIEHLAPGCASAPNALDLLRWPGVLLDEQPDADMLGAAALALLAETASELESMRAREGARLAELIEQRLAGIESLASTVTARLPEAIGVQRARLRERLAELMAQPPGERLDQELALLAARGDVAEELDRLGAHVAEARRSLRAGGACGRRLDFLMQEFNREANTLSSKSLATEITQAALEMKVLIEQMREQVQNIE
jgi:uncharacterized protein (TIGR00255 family)